MISNGLLTNYTSLLDNRVKMISAKVGEKADSEYLKYMNKRDAQERITTDLGVTGLGMGGFINDAQVSPSDAPIQGFEKNYFQQHLVLKTTYSFMTFFFLYKAKNPKLKADIEKKVNDLFNGLEQAKEYYGQNFLANGFNTSWSFQPISSVAFSALTVTATGADGVELWTTAHPREDGGPNWGNVIFDGTIPSPVGSESGLEGMHQIYSLVKDGRGLPFGGEIDKVIALKGSATAQVFKRLKGTIDRGFYPGTLNDSPSIPTFDLVLLKNFGLTGVGALQWGGMDSSRMSDDYGLQYLEAMPNTMAPSFQDPYNHDFILSAHCLLTMGAADMRNMNWSNGDGVTS